MRVWTCESCGDTVCEVYTEGEKAPRHCPYDLIPHFHMEAEE